MLKETDIKSIIDSVRNEGHDVGMQDLAFLLLRGFVPVGVAYGMAFQRYAVSRGKDIGKEAAAYCATPKVKALDAVLRTFGIGTTAGIDISKAENKSDLIRLLKELQDAKANGEIETKDALKIEADIRVKLNDKFSMDEDDGPRRILVVPQKHDIVCPHTHMECTYMPTKKACMEYYKLK